MAADVRERRRHSCEPLPLQARALLRRACCPRPRATPPAEAGDRGSARGHAVEEERSGMFPVFYFFIQIQTPATCGTVRSARGTWHLTLTWAVLLVGCDVTSHTMHASQLRVTAAARSAARSAFHACTQIRWRKVGRTCFFHCAAKRGSAAVAACACPCSVSLGAILRRNARKLVVVRHMQLRDTARAALGTGGAPETCRARACLRPPSGG
jgi:hypothetical protein